jgi:uncharacterized membrane protein YdjX (TVP38/TMEM64 family)
MKEKVIGSIPINGSMKAFLNKLKPYKDILENVISLFVVFGLIVVLFYVFDLSEVKTFVDRFGVWAPVVFVFTKASTMVFAPLSGSPLYPVAGALFGFWKGFWILTLGDFLGGTISFWIARVYGLKITERFVKSESSLIKKILTHLGTLKGFIFARICFMPMPEIVCYAAGLTKMSYMQFIIVHMLVSIPMTAVLVGAGALFTFELSPLIIFGLLAVGTIATIIGGAWFYKQTK